MKFAPIIFIALTSTDLFAAESSCYLFQKSQESGNVKIQVIPNRPELASKVVALNEEVADRLEALGKEGTLCVKGTATTAGYLAFDAYSL